MLGTKLKRSSFDLGNGEENSTSLIYVDHTSGTIRQSKRPKLDLSDSEFKVQLKFEEDLTLPKSKSPQYQSQQTDTHQMVPSPNSKKCGGEDLSNSGFFFSLWNKTPSISSRRKQEWEQRGSASHFEGTQGDEFLCLKPFTPRSCFYFPS